MLNLKDDRYYIYPGGTAPTRLNVLANDIFPADFTLTPPPSGSFGPTYRVLPNNELEVTDPGFFLSNGDYTVTDNVTGQSASATIDYTVFSEGTAGIGGFFYFIPDVTEDDGIVTVNIRDMTDPLGTNTYVDPLSDDIFTSFSSTYTGLDAILDNGLITIDLDQFSGLDDGEKESITIYVGASDGSSSETSRLYLTVSGVTDPVTTINTAAADGRMSGTTGNDRIISVVNQDTALFGDRGADVFVFGSDLFDNNSDEKTIQDYTTSQDTIEFAAGTEIFVQFEYQNGVMLVLDGGQDVVFVQGDQLTLYNLEMSGHVFKAPDPTSGSAGSGTYDPIYNLLYLSQLQSVQQNFDFLNGWTPNSPFSWADSQGWSIG